MHASRNNGWRRAARRLLASAVLAVGVVAGTSAAASAVGTGWVKAHARTVNGKTVLKVGGKKRKLPHADLGRLARAVTSS